jgi:hypothetical protein
MRARNTNTLNLSQLQAVIRSCGEKVAARIRPSQSRFESSNERSDDSQVSNFYWRPRSRDRDGENCNAVPMSETPGKLILEVLSRGFGSQANCFSVDTVVCGAEDR